MSISESHALRLSVAEGEPLASIGADIGGPRVDDLLRRAAERAPERPALRAAGGDLTYAELDAEVDRCAAVLAGLGAGPDQVVAIAAALAPVFAIGYYAISRAGAVSVPVNPLLRAEGLEHVLRTSGAVVAILTPEVHAVLAPARDRLPLLRHVLLTRPDPEAPEAVVLRERMARVTTGPAPAARDAEDVASILFTSGTTGAPKAVRLTHRNLTVNAAQTAHAHGLTADSVIFNYLPTFHLMHLNIATHAGCAQILHADPDVAASTETARRYGVTHYYSLPMRLSRLAADPNLADLRLTGVHAILSGGSALPPPVTARLAGHFGVPVVQGYGLAEASPQTHFDRPAAPVAGSCGPPSAGTGCRVVDVDARHVLPVGDKGEIQVRGPQLMKGYLGEEPSAHLDGEGWFSTGDIGVMDAEGRLFVVDRLKDVFKCDNFLVSPTEIERVLARHPAVADCVVVDRPDEFSGAVACALVVSRDPETGAAELAEFVNGQLPYYQHLRHVELVDAIPRSQNGKIQRRELRALVLDRPDPTVAPKREARTVVTIINKLTVTGDPVEFEQLLGKITSYMKSRPGFVSHRLYRSLKNSNVFVETGEWEDMASHQQAMMGSGFQEILPELIKHATADIDLYQTVEE
ncbi:AMP-binding protein [Sphaerisporangium perillae]|uniref:AMP-binding protein n=1 Tax=Sphaerisporangium perillae TaxID=2935860 RepID=UPI00200F9218|nr:AMP-binding protein [Sphaerisporangium perillae]